MSIARACARARPFGSLPPPLTTNTPSKYVAVHNRDKKKAGSTATTCLVLGPRLYMANVGDSRTVLCRGGKLRMASNDHKPCRADEQERVQRAGGYVSHRRVRVTKRKRKSTLIYFFSSSFFIRVLLQKLGSSISYGICMMIWYD